MMNGRILFCGGTGEENLMNIVLIGPSGAGKGTQSDLIAAHFNLVHIASGDLFRENVTRKTKLGLSAKTYMDQGELVPDEITESIMRDHLRQIGIEKGLVLDGYPRTGYQAEGLDRIMESMGEFFDAVIYLRVSDEIAINDRIPGRLTCKECQRPYHKTHNPPQTPFKCDVCGGDLFRRNDDTPERAKARLEVFHRQASRLVSYYQKNQKLIIIDGDGTIAEVNARIHKAIGSLPPRDLFATQEQTREIENLKAVSVVLSPEQADYSLDIVLLGPPGAGKGTQAERLCEQFNLKHVATGDLFRENLRNDTELGKLAKKYMNRGELVPDDVTEAMVRERLSQPDIRRGFILDGFPRTLPQAEALTNIITSLNRRIDAVLYFNVSDEILINRLSGRLICRECQTPFHKTHNPFTHCPLDKCQGQYLYQRDDDRPEVVRARLQIFHGETSPLIGYYAEWGLLIEIDGTRSIEGVTENTIAAVSSLIENSVEKSSR
jgi:adenylate kinase